MKVFREFIKEDVLPYSAFLITRDNMPQIDNNDDFESYLNQQGIETIKSMMDMADLNPTQVNSDQTKVDDIASKMPKDTSNQKSIIASNDNFILDGHHRYMAANQNGSQYPVMSVDLPINKLLATANDYNDQED